MIESDFPICPYCKNIHHDIWELELEDGDIIHMICDVCGEKFSVLCEKVVTYNTEKIDKKEVKDELD